MKLYISGPITGHENYMDDFAFTEKAVRALFV